MQRLKHPIKRAREPFGKAGLTVAILALVLAMVGGAYAAGGLTSQQEKQVKKIAKKFAGKPGAAGTNGTNGTNGAKGDPGVGTKGDPGEPGTSVTNTPLAKGEGGCPEGGAKFTVGAGTPTKACNGQTGFTETLPPGKTETGIWNIGPLNESVAPNGSTFGQFASFPIPLANPLDAAHVHYINAAEEEVTEYSGGNPVTVSPTECLGSAAQPTAEPGNLCVYETIGINLELASKSIVTPAEVEPGALTAGAFAYVFIQEFEAFARGTWAVTAGP